MRTTRDGIAQMVEHFPHYSTTAAMRRAIPKLLRRRDAYWRRRVKSIVAQRKKRVMGAFGYVGAEKNGYVAACTDILAALKEMP